MRVLGILLIFFVLRTNSLSRNFGTGGSGRSGNLGTDGSANPNVDNVMCKVKTIIDSSAGQIQSTCEDLPKSNDREVKGAKAKCNTATRNLNSLSRSLPKDCSDSSQTTNSPNPETIKTSTQYFTTPISIETTRKDSSTPTPVETTTQYSPISTSIKTTTEDFTTPVMKESTTEDSPNPTTVEETTEYSETPELAETTTQYFSTPMLIDTTPNNIPCHEILIKRCNDHCLNHRRINLGGSCRMGEGNSVKCECIKVKNCEVYQNATCQNQCKEKSSNDYCKIPEKNIPCACRFQSGSSKNIYYELP
ncbi:hypothetical protein HNY73_021858 [Argiope bruennichi]|uniref:Uncharacterized protein n=1 Tax=Argiope bruennichi TaxID=94029 RepID=A0A8T0DZU0_ARGBR|nr:hypothetical protein HNY73_021858 [Argiope bruennichi]